MYGTNTGNLGVIETESMNVEKIRVSNVERTLIDISLRPFYSGGVAEIFGAGGRNPFDPAQDRLPDTGGSPPGF